MEAAVNGLGYTEEKDGVLPAVIPFRDQEEGWDDWPPIFTPQYMPFHGAVATHTIEFPMRVNNEEYDTQPVAELRRRAAINVDIAGAAMRASIDYTQKHRTSVGIADQIEVFRRGATGAEQVPVSEEDEVPGVPGIGPEDVYTTKFPRAYVIPAGHGQRSATAAARLVDHLVANDVRVKRASRGFRLGGRTYAKGSYVVDMHQPKRGLANVMLADGRDISDKVSTMYDISGWSLGRLWGASVDPVEGGSLKGVHARVVHAASDVGYVAPRGGLRLRLDDPREVAALNSLLAKGVTARSDGKGGAILPSSARGRRPLRRRRTTSRSTPPRPGAAPRCTARGSRRPSRRVSCSRCGRWAPTWCPSPRPCSTRASTGRRRTRSWCRPGSTARNSMRRRGPRWTRSSPGAAASSAVARPVPR
ncbi:hypothetical protein SALBM135S_02219 [Streptomyces alboniger]